MSLPTEPIGSVPRPDALIHAIVNNGTTVEIAALQDRALADTISRFENTGSPVIADGEQTKPSFVTYPLHGSPLIAPGGMPIDFADGHRRQLPVLSQGPFRFTTYASSFVTEARKRTKLPVKQAVISASALSLIYPAEGIPGYPREAFVADLVNECEKDIRGCLEAGAQGADRFH
jgi:5-methyltetrahydropteroyltriglutamate--homocysteine methyltransferase